MREEPSSKLTPHWDKGTPFVAVVEQLKQWSNEEKKKPAFMHRSQKSLYEGHRLVFALHLAVTFK